MRSLPLAAALIAAAVLAGSPAAVASGAERAATPGPANQAASADREALRSALKPCRLKGLTHEALCGSVRRPLDPAQPAGVQIEVHFAVLPALARRKQPDPVVFFAGGPGQSAIALAGSLERPLARLMNRRDLVLIDQRGTGRSAALMCPAAPVAQPLGLSVDSAAQMKRLDACRQALQALPHGDLRHYSTSIAAGDVEAVRLALGAPALNLLGVSYGTRVALEYQRQFPQAVRRSVLDGVVPPDMALPASFSRDNQAALDAVFTACEADAACSARHPSLRAGWARLLAELPREVLVSHPLSGREERLRLSREALLALVRGPLYVPALASALPFALGEAVQGRFTPLFGLAAALPLGSDPSLRLAEGMHFSVICSEDMPRLSDRAALDAAGADFGEAFASLYQRICAAWPRAALPAGFYGVPRAQTPVLVLSGGADPATPPRHGERVVRALGPLARHAVVPEGGHGLMLRGCLADAVFRFIQAASVEEALAVDTACAAATPRPPAFSPPVYPVEMRR